MPSCTCHLLINCMPGIVFYVTLVRKFFYLHPIEQVIEQFRQTELELFMEALCADIRNLLWLENRKVFDTKRGIKNTLYGVSISIHLII